MPNFPGEYSTRPTSLTLQDCLMIVVIGLLACLPFYLHGLPLSLDLNHHYRTALGFYESIVSRNYYPSWHPSANGGYGDISVRFYPPALYFVLCAFRLITRDWFLAGLLTVTLLAIISALGMYVWATSFTSHYFGLLAGLLFVFSPFHVNEVYQSGMYGQYAAASVLPFAFAFVERIIQRGRNAEVALLGLSYGLLVLCNIPLAILSSISMAVYALIRLVQSFKVSSVYRLVTGVTLGLALSCFYWLPVLRELKWKSPSGTGQGAWFDYRNNFVFHTSPSDMSNFFLPFLVLATIAMALPVTILVVKKEKEAIATGVVGVLGFLMSTALSKPIWDRLPILQETQFPWRWMTIVSACISLLAAVSFSKMYSMWYSRLRPLCILSIGFVLIALSFTILQLMRGALLSDRTSFNQTVELLRGSKTNQDFLPVWANGQVSTMKSEIEAPSRAVKIMDWSAERKVFSIETGQEIDVRLKTYYYPYWFAFANGQRLVTAPAGDGALLVRVPSEETIVTVVFTEPQSSYVAALVSTLTLAMIVLLLVLPARRFNRFLKS